MSLRVDSLYHPHTGSRTFTVRTLGMIVKIILISLQSICRRRFSKRPCIRGLLSRWYNNLLYRLHLIRRLWSLCNRSTLYRSNLRRLCNRSLLLFCNLRCRLCLFHYGSDLRYISAFYGFCRFGLRLSIHSL